MTRLADRLLARLSGMRPLGIVIVVLLAANLVLTALVVMRPLRAGQQPAIIVGESAGLQDIRQRLETLSGQVFLTGYELPDRVTICGSPVPIGERDVAERLEREFLSTLNYRFRVVDLLKRSRRYFPAIEGILRQRGLPDDLKYLLVSESDLNVKAVSPASAVGIAQFIPKTARRYLLTVDDDIDDRRHLEKSVNASASYLADLYGMFKDWPLAMAAYNTGEDRVKQGLAEQGVRDYYHMKLPLETERYIFRIISAKIIMSAPDEYGFHLDKERCYAPIPYDSVRVHSGSRIRIRDIARACGSTYRDIRELNPHFVNDAIPPGMRWIRVPEGTGASFYAAFKG